MPAWKPDRRGRNISGWWNKVAENPTKIERWSREKCWNWFRLIISLNHCCLSVSNPSLLQSRLGCLTLLDTHAQLCSVHRSAYLSDEEYETYLRFDFFKLRHVWNVPFFFCGFTIAACWTDVDRAVADAPAACGATDLWAFLRRWHQNMRPLTPRLGCCRLLRYHRLLIDRSFSCQHLRVPESTWVRPCPRLRVSNKNPLCACVHAWTLS